MQIFFGTLRAYVHYPDDDTYEELDLKELIKDSHIAFSECIPFSYVSHGV